MKECLNCGKSLENKPKNKYCNNICQLEYQSKQKYEYFLTNPEELQRANWDLPESFRQNIRNEQDNKCAICGITPI